MDFLEDLAKNERKSQAVCRVAEWLEHPEHGAKIGIAIDGEYSGMAIGRQLKKAGVTLMSDKACSVQISRHRKRECPCFSDNPEAT
jgi:hypothetical protein